MRARTRSSEGPRRGARGLLWVVALGGCAGPAAPAVEAAAPPSREEAPAAPVGEVAVEIGPEEAPASRDEPPWAVNPSLWVGSEAAAQRSGCRALAVIGDSTSTGSTSDKYVRDPERRLDRRLAAVGVEDLRLELRGGRSLIEHRAKNESGLMVAQRLRESGFTGCWIIGLGTNDAANVAKDPTIPHAERITRMMAIIGDEPVLWIDAETRREDGYWARAHMSAWNEALAATLRGRPSARIYTWSAEVREEWFVSDGIHYTSAGYTARAERVALALAAAFPAR